MSLRYVVEKHLENGLIKLEQKPNKTGSTLVRNA